MKISKKVVLLFGALFVMADVLAGEAEGWRAAVDSVKHPLVYINTNFENASQLDWKVDAEGIVNVSMIYDHERSSPNRANGHWHFQVVAASGSVLTFLLKNF